MSAAPAKVTEAVETIAAALAERTTTVAYDWSKPTPEQREADARFTAAVRKDARSAGDLAKVLGVSERTIARWRDGTTVPASAIQARVLGVLGG